MNEITAFNATGANIEAPETMPHSIEAEQQLLGAILTNNDIYDRIESIIGPEHFFDPVHARIFEISASRIKKNNLASPVTLKAFMEDDEGLKELGGPAYLARLAGAAISAFAARDYAQMIYDLGIRRDLIGLGQDIAAKAAKVDVDQEPAEQIIEAEQKLYKLAEQGQSESGFQSFLKAVTDAVNVANAAYQREGGMSGVSTGLIDMDKKLGGLHKSDLLILAGRPSMGKTSLATNIAFNAARRWVQEREDGIEESKGSGAKVAFFSLEMSADQLATRILAEQSGISSELLRMGKISRDDFWELSRASRELQELPLFIDDTPALTIAALRARARRLQRRHGIGLIVVDYLQLLQGTSRASDNRVNEISEISRGLKTLAKELSIPVVALSQLSRAVEQREDKTPMLSDLRESGSIEQDADMVWFVYREDYYELMKKPDEGTPAFEAWNEKMERIHGIAELIISKQRHGSTGRVRMKFESKITRFSDLADDQYADAGYD